MSRRNAAQPDGGLPLYGSLLAFSILLVTAFTVSLKYKNRELVPSLAPHAPVITNAEPELLALPTEAVVQDVEETHAEPAPPCVHPVLDLHDPKYLALCNAQKSPTGQPYLITGDDCQKFLEMAWVTGDDSISPDFKRPEGCPGE